MARLRIEAVSKRFGQTEAVRRVSLDIPDGEFLVLLGPADAGNRHCCVWSSGWRSRARAR